MSADEAVMFPPFVQNEADPLYVFSDAVVHVDVFRTHPLAEKALARVEEGRRRAGPGKYVCMVCGLQIHHVDEYLGLGHLIDDASHPLYEFNWAQFHRSCVRDWAGLHELLNGLNQLNSSGLWRGDSLNITMGLLRSCSA